MCTHMCFCPLTIPRWSRLLETTLILFFSSVQVNIPAESGEMGVLANHVPSIEQLKPGLVEIIEESGGSKQFFCAYHVDTRSAVRG